VGEQIRGVDHGTRLLTATNARAASADSPVCRPTDGPASRPTDGGGTIENQDGP
jgi:hypothetical protein